MLPTKFKTRITMWFSLILIVMLALVIAIMTLLNSATLQRDIYNRLIQVVSENANDVSVHISDTVPTLGKLHIKYGNGYIIIDEYFLKTESGVYSALYTKGGELIFGEDPLSDSDIPFVNNIVRNTEYGNIKYYIFDREIDKDSSLYLRGIISTSDAKSATSELFATVMLLFPLLTACAIMGGYMIASKFVAPINKISETAKRIYDGNDLSCRLPILKNNDEISRLSDDFNSMFERLEQAFEREKRFGGDLSHELRTPLSVIRSECEFALEKERSADEYRESLETIERNILRMSALTSDMLTLTRLENRECPMTNCDLSGIAIASSNESGAFNERDIKLRTEIEDGIFVKGNPELLQVLIVNLISNAYRYGKDNGNILLKLHSDGDNAFLSVEDDGIGIKPENIPKIFDRLFRADESRSKVGNGIGLALVKSIAVLHGGDVNVISTYGKGSCFTFKIKIIKI